MAKLLKDLGENLIFVLVCAAIAAVISIVAKLAEKKLSLRPVSRVKRICIIAVCGAIAAILHIFDFPMPFLAPGFYKLDFSEVPVMLCGFYLGPSATVLCELLKILLKLVMKGTSTAFVGDFANFFVGCSLVLPATIFYHTKKSRKSALIGLLLGTMILTVFGSIFNGIYLIPKFSDLYGIPLDAIIEMGTAINGSITSLWGLVLLSVAPLNLLKGAIVSLLTLLLYKKVARPLFDK